MSLQTPSSTPGSADSTTAWIPVRSHRQAMDWGLVLASQGITGTIDRSEDGHGWGLVVDRRDYAAAVKALKLYQLENRGWGWQQALPLPSPAAHFDWASVLWAVLLCVFYWAASVNPHFQAAGVMSSTEVAHGQWWRIFTAMLLHEDLGHLATNLSIGIVMVGLAMGRYASGVGLLAAYLAGAGGNVASLLFNARPFAGLGASGMIMGALGLLAAQSLDFRKSIPRPMRFVTAGITAGVMLLLWFGLSPGSDVAAHFGGFGCGLALGVVLILLPARWLHSAWLNLAGLAALGALITLTWRLAL